MRSFNSIFFPLILILHCFQSFGQTCDPDSLFVDGIHAIETDSNINDEILQHQIFINPSCAQNNKLLLHLVGSFDNPANTTYFPTLAANNGFKVVVLKYPNFVTAFGSCANSNDVDCYEKFREEIIYGINSSPDVDVDSNNCILNRTIKLLLHLANLYPNHGWENFIAEPENINWSNIILSGHSQGGGHAAFLAKEHEVDRVLMFASPNDYSNFFEAPAPWVSQLSSTADSNYYAFGNLFDEVVAYNKQYEIWEAMNMLSFGDSTNVDVSSVIFNNARTLYTKDTTSTSEAGNHNGVIIDQYTPFESGNPVFKPVWEYMIGITDGPDAIDELEDPSLVTSAYPNPTNGILFISSKIIISKIEIYDLTGKLLHEVHPKRESFEINLESYSGLVFLQIFSANQKRELLKIVIQ